MYKETDKKNAGFSVIAAFVVIAVVWHLILSILPILTIIKDAAFMVVMVAFVLILIKRYLTAYEYELTDERIIITAWLGDRERARAEAEYSAIKLFCASDDERLKSVNVIGQTLCAKTKNRYALVFDTEVGCAKVIFAPSEELVSLLNDKLQTTAGEE